MSKLLSKIFPVESKSNKQPKQGNGIAIFCGIVSIITCCYSCNLAYNRYEDARNQFIRASRLIEQSNNVIQQTTDRRDETKNASDQHPFI